MLVSDGGDNCAPPSPCAVAGQIARRGSDLSVQAIGFQVSGRARDQLRCIAERGRGVYRDAADADELAVALRALAARGTRTFTPSGTRISGGAGERDATPISSGRFLDRIAAGDVRWYRVALRRGQRLAASATLILACPPDADSADSIGLGLVMEVLDLGGVPDATAATANLFMSDMSVESVGLLTAPIAPDATAPAGGARLLRVAFDAEPDGALAQALDGAAVPLQLELNVLGTSAQDRSRAPAPAPARTGGGGGGGGVGVAASIAVLVGCLLLGVIAGATARLRRLRGAT